MNKISILIFTHLLKGNVVPVQEEKADVKLAV